MSIPNKSTKDTAVDHIKILHLYYIKFRGYTFFEIQGLFSLPVSLGWFYYMLVETCITFKKKTTWFYSYNPGVSNCRYLQISGVKSPASGSYGTLEVFTYLFDNRSTTPVYMYTVCILHKIILIFYYFKMFLKKEINDRCLNQHYNLQQTDLHCPIYPLVWCLRSANSSPDQDQEIFLKHRPDWLAEFQIAMFMAMIKLYSLELYVVSNNR